MEETVYEQIRRFISYYYVLNPGLKYSPRESMSCQNALVELAKVKIVPGGKVSTGLAPMSSKYSVIGSISITGGSLMTNFLQIES
jgi:hypothetical protein